MVVLSTLIAGWIIENYSIPTAIIFTSFHYLFALLGTISVIVIWKKSNNILNRKF